MSICSFQTNISSIFSFRLQNEQRGVRRLLENLKSVPASYRLCSGDKLLYPQDKCTFFLWSRSNNNSYLSKPQPCLTFYAADSSKRPRVWSSPWNWRLFVALERSMSAPLPVKPHECLFCCGQPGSGSGSRPPAPAVNVKRSAAISSSLRKTSRQQR